jgi:sirohydrochlorin ferrochelatase
VRYPRLTALRTWSGPARGIGRRAGGLRVGADRSSSGSAVLLVAHGSRDPRAEAVTVDLAGQVRSQLPGRIVRVAYLDFSRPTVGEALRSLAADDVREVVVVPLLFAPGYHLRVDLPAAVAEVRAGLPSLDVVIAAALGEAAPDGPDLLLDALEARLAARPAAGGAASTIRSLDAVVLASAGSSDPQARAAIEDIAQRWAGRSGRPVVAAYGTSCGPTVSAAIGELHDRGLSRVGVASLFIAPGRLPEAARRAGLEAGASAVSAPLGTTPALVRLVTARALARKDTLAPLHR